MRESQSGPEPHDVDAVVIGAGFSGLYMLYRLRELGMTTVVLEAGSGVGGTWFWNRYPGARCDSESHVYSYSFSPELEQEWVWSERYPGQAEIRRYLDHVTDRFELRRDICFDTRVAAAEYHEDTDRWSVRTEDGRSWTGRFLITAVGCLSAANIPEVPGLESFGGDWYHTGTWPPDGVDLTGRRVGVIGTGSTGIQVIPEVAQQATHLTVFQRTPNYSVPARNAPLTERQSVEIKRHYPAIRRLQRSSTNGHPYLISERSALEATEQERRAVYEAGWAHGGLRFRAGFADLLTDELANETASDFIRAKIREVVRDPETAERLTPRDHPFASKRPPIDTHYFETYNLPHVDLVDVRATPIREITASGIRTEDREYPLDTIVFATGFDAMTGPLLRIDIRGSGGRGLREAWAAGPRTYLGLQVAGFPNLFTVTGPGSPSVLSNMPTCIEQHVEWIAECLGAMRAGGFDRIEATEQAQDEWVLRVNEAADRTLLPLAGTSWYLGANVPGKARVFMPYAGGLYTYARTCDDVAARGYAGFLRS